MTGVVNLYELIVLSLLMRRPAHGYLIGKILNNVIGPVARASNGRIYPLLAKLQDAAMIDAYDEEQDGRQVRTFRITDAGRQRWYELMMDTGSNPREYQELFSFKVSVLDLLTPEERLHLIDHYAHYCQAHILHLRRGLSEVEAARNECNAGSAQQDALFSVLQHRMRQWELELAWAQSLRSNVQTEEVNRT